MKCGRIYKNFLPYPGTVQNGHTRAGPGSGTGTVPGKAYCTGYSILYSNLLPISLYIFYFILLLLQYFIIKLLYIPLRLTDRYYGQLAHKFF